MGRPLNPREAARYDEVRHQIKGRMRASGVDRRVTLPEIVGALQRAGYARSHRVLRAVLSGEKRSRPALREISAAIDAVRRQRRAERPDWL